jgi:hypothetical protein
LQYLEPPVLKELSQELQLLQLISKTLEQPITSELSFKSMALLAILVESCPQIRGEA